MAILSEIASSKPKKQYIELTVKDTDFLLKLFMKSVFEGAELERANSVLQKLAELHKRNLNED